MGWSAVEDGSGGKSTTGQVRNRGRVGWVIDDEWGLVIDGLVQAARRNSGHRLLPFLSALVCPRDCSRAIFSINLLISAHSLAFLLLFICFHHVRFLPPSIIYNLVSVSVASI